MYGEARTCTYPAGFQNVNVYCAKLTTSVLAEHAKNKATNKVGNSGGLLPIVECSTCGITTPSTTNIDAPLRSTGPKMDVSNEFPCWESLFLRRRFP